MIDWGNVRMIKKRCELGFLLKTHAIEFRGKEHLSQHFQCHRPSQTCVRGFVDHAHPPAGNLALHSIVAKGGREIDRREGRLNWLRVIESQTGKSTNKSTGRAGRAFCHLRATRWAGPLKWRIQEQLGGKAVHNDKQENSVAFLPTNDGVWLNSA